jgi:DNA-directed RNA polymerase specialized sigma24 family protein
MTNQQRVELVYKKHHKWLLAVAYNLTQNQEEAENLIQDVYLQLLEMQNLEKIVYNEIDLNLFYLYKIIKSKFLNNVKAEQKLNKTALKEDLIESTADEEYDVQRDENTERLLQLVDEALNDELHWFDSKLFVTYIEEDHSIQSLHNATKISKNAIFTSLRKTKTLIKTRAQDENLYY